MVSIPLWFLRNLPLTKPSRNTKQTCFHTTMVLTQQKRSKNLHRWRLCVSIPLWFLRNRHGTYCRPTRQFGRFHTTMVLTQRTPPKPQGRRRQITFPYHYGSHATAHTGAPAWRPLQFPYHYGSHATGTATHAEPLNCSRFHTTMVLTQRIFSRLEVDNPLLWKVSIPLWFLRNSPFPCPQNLKYWFPYHYGSYATKEVKGNENAVFSFHTTMVLTQQIDEITKSNTTFLSFHTTMVLTQRKFVWWNGNVVMKVSIPLWFLRNGTITSHKYIQFPKFPYHYGSYATDECSQDMEVTIKFPYHYGSYATINLFCFRVCSYCFHTTMVLTQRWR